MAEQAIEEAKRSRATTLVVRNSLSFLEIPQMTAESRAALCRILLIYRESDSVCFDVQRTH